MSDHDPEPVPGSHTNGARDPAVDSDDDFDPGDTLNRGMSIACSLVLLFFALISCGFIYSVLSSHR